MNSLRNSFKPLTWLIALLLAAFIVGCGSGGGNSGGGGGSGATTVLPGTAGTPGAATTDPTVIASNPGNLATNVPTSTNGPGNVVTGKLVTATFNEAMQPLTITTSGTFTLKVTGGADVPGTVTMNTANTVATFTPTASALLPDTNYTATVTTAAKNTAGTAMPNAVAWSFTTNATVLTGQAPVNLGLAGDYAIFADTGIANATAGTVVTGDMGVGPGVTSTAITGPWALVLDASGVFSTSVGQVTGRVYAFDYAAPTPVNVTTASTDMLAAYNDAAGRTAGVGPFLNLGGGTVTTQTLTPGVYTWGTSVTLPFGNNLTLSGGPNDVWIFQIAGALTTSANTSVFLTGGALARNVFWQVAGGPGVTLGANARLEGIVLTATTINLGNQASAGGRLLARTAVNLDQNAVTQPAP